MSERQWASRRGQYVELALPGLDVLKVSPSHAAAGGQKLVQLVADAFTSREREPTVLFADVETKKKLDVTISKYYGYFRIPEDGDNVQIPFDEVKAIAMQLQDSGGEVAPR